MKFIRILLDSTLVQESPIFWIKCIVLLAHVVRGTISPPEDTSSRKEYKTFNTQDNMPCLVPFYDKDYIHLISERF